MAEIRPLQEGDIENGRGIGVLPQRIAFTVAGIDDFFLFQINNSHKKPDFYTSFILIICFVVNCLDGKFTIIL